MKNGEIGHPPLSVPH